MIDEVPDPKELNEATERLNQVLLEAEAALRDLQLGVPASVPLYDDGRLLQFRKIDSSFQLVVMVGTEARPILTASRDARVRAAERLHQLLDSLFAAYEAEVDRVIAAVGTATDFISTLRHRDARGG